jgi:Cof subfamily protein (haloacid dehalogenase superfamily)
MPYKLIAADLDGTLRVDHKPFTPRLLRAIRDAQQFGTRVVIATGRMLRTVAPFAETLGVKDAIICNHGAIIYDNWPPTILLEHRMPSDLACEVIERASDDLTLLVCVDDEFYSPRASEAVDHYVGPHKDHLHIVADLSESLVSRFRQAPQKIVFVNEEAATDALYVELKLRFGQVLQVVRSYPTFVELTHRDASKGKAVAWMANRWGIRQDQVIAVGDEGNDISMIEWAGLGVAMGNAVENVKAIADHIAPSVEEDDVAEIIERFILNENARKT